MKAISTYITEKFQVSKDIIRTYKYYPQTKEELREILEERLAEDKDANLNDINVSAITDMGPLDDGDGLFEDLDPHNIDISEWDIYNVTNTSYMFFRCYNFNADLSSWDMSNVISMSFMFNKCINFNSNLSKWDVSNVMSMNSMFYECKNFNSDLSKWNVSNVEFMPNMFNGCENFTGYGLEKWNVTNAKSMKNMFNHCYLLKNTPTWYKE